MGLVSDGLLVEARIPQQARCGHQVGFVWRFSWVLVWEVCACQELSKACGAYHREFNTCAAVKMC